MKCAFPLPDAQGLCSRPIYAHDHGDLGHPFHWPRGVPRRLRQRRLGTNNPNNVLTQAQVDVVLTTRDSARRLAKQFRVSPSMIARIRGGSRWGWYTPPGCLYRKGGRDGTGLRARVRAKKLPAGAPRLKRPVEVAEQIIHAARRKDTNPIVFLDPESAVPDDDELTEPEGPVGEADEHDAPPFDPDVDGAEW